MVEAKMETVDAKSWVHRLSWTGFIVSVVPLWRFSRDLFCTREPEQAEGQAW
jgi:hypothetical protein